MIPAGMWRGNLLDLPPVTLPPRIPFRPKPKLPTDPQAATPSYDGGLLNYGDSGIGGDGRPGTAPGPGETPGLASLTPDKGGALSGLAGALGSSLGGPLAGAAGAIGGGLAGGWGTGKSIGAGAGGLLGLAGGPLTAIAGSLLGGYLGSSLFDPAKPGAMYDDYDQIQTFGPDPGIGIGGLPGPTGPMGSIGNVGFGYGALGSPSSFGFDASGNITSGFTGNETSVADPGPGPSRDSSPGQADQDTASAQAGNSGGGDSGGGGGGDGGGTCFVAGTMVLMADFSTKAIEELRIGDEVQSFDDTGAVHTGRVTDTMSYPGRDTLLMDGIRVTAEHPFLTDHGFRAIGTTNVGDILIGENGQRVERLPHVNSGHHTVFNISVEPHRTYIVAGKKNSYRVHNEDGKRTGGRIPADGDDRLEPRRIKAHEGEYVIRPEAAAYYGGLLDLLNERRIPRSAFRGLLG